MVDLRIKELGPPLSDQEIFSVISETSGLVQWNDRRMKERNLKEREPTEFELEQRKLLHAHLKKKQKKT